MVDFNNLESPYFIGEIGINHNGDLQVAKKLIDAVFACSWDCAKFQKRSPDICVPGHQKNIIRDTPWGKMTYLEYKHRVEFQETEYDYINNYCSNKPLHWTASVWDLESLEFILKYAPPFIKIPSAMVTNTELISEISKTGIPVIMSTGMCELTEIDTSVDLIRKHTSNLALMHTNSSYPTPRDELNLNLIPFLEQRYNCPVGYSGHEEDLEPSVLAVSLGAKIIERHITLSHSMWGTDQKCSLEIHAMNMLYKRSKDIDIMMGSATKQVTKSEIDIRKKLRGN